MRNLSSIGVAFMLASLLPPLGFSQAASTETAPVETAPAAAQTSEGAASGHLIIGVGVKVSTLGAGIEAATAVTRRSDVRIAFNVFDYSVNTSKDGLNYGGTLNLRSVEMRYDQYFFKGFHVSPGLVVNGNQGTARIAVPGGRSFTLNNTSYFSSAANPIAGNGTLDFNRVAPEILIGVGNLLPRGRRHFGVNFEIGAVFQGSPNATLNLTGSTCNSQGSFCQSVGSNPGIQSNIQAEQTKVNNSLSFFKYYPVISMGFSYKF
jgi:hypothetical protein